MNKLSDLRYEFEIFERQHKHNNFKSVWLARKKKYHFLILIFTIITILIGVIVVTTWLAEFNLIKYIYSDALDDLTESDWFVYKGSSKPLNLAEKKKIIYDDIPRIFTMLLPIILLVLAFGSIVPVGASVNYIQTSNLPQNNEHRKKILVNALLLNTILMSFVSISIIAVKNVFISFLFKTKISQDLPLFEAMSNFLVNFIWAIWMLSFFYLFILVFASECRFKLIVSMQFLYIMLLISYYYLVKNFNNNPIFIKDIIKYINSRFGIPFCILGLINIVFLTFTLTSHTTAIKLYLRFDYINIKLICNLLFFGTASFLIIFSSAASHFISMQTVSSVVKRLSIKKDLIIFSNNEKFDPNNYWNPAKDSAILYNTKILSFFRSSDKISAQASIIDAIYIVGAYITSLYALVALKYRVDGIYKQSKPGFIYSYLITMLVICLCFFSLFIAKKFSNNSFGYGVSNKSLIYMMLIIFLNISNLALCNSISLIDYKMSILYILFIITIGDLSIVQVVEQLIVVKFDKTDKIIDINYLSQVVTQLIASFIVVLSFIGTFRKSLNSNIYIDGEKFDMIDESLFVFSDLVYKYNFRRDYIKENAIKNSNESYIYEIEYLRLRTEINYISLAIKVLKKNNNQYSDILINNKIQEQNLHIALAYYLKIKHKYLIKVVRKREQNNRLKQHFLNINSESMIENINLDNSNEIIEKKIKAKYISRLHKNHLLSKVKDFDKEIPINMVIDFHNNPNK